MAEFSSNLEIPFILPSQAQKHVTHNEALLVLDALVQLTISDEITAPPPSPQEGICYLVGEAATMEWAGRDGQIAAWQDGGWTFHRPLPGWRAWFAASETLAVFWENEWRPALPASPRFQRLGINADGDAANRLAVSSPASLFDHAGSDHHLKINKAAAGDTGSLLFQTGYTGHAELGLAGNNAFSIKVSDGATWKTALVIDEQGRHARPSQPAMRAYRTGTTASPTGGQQSGFTHFGLERGGFALGGSMPGGGNAVTVPAGGTYLACLQVTSTASSGHAVALALNGTPAALRVTGPSGFSGTLSASAVMELAAGDLLSLHHTGTATIALGDGGTQLSLALL